MNEYERLNKLHREIKEANIKKAQLREEANKAIIKSSKRDWVFGIAMAVIGAILGAVASWLLSCQ